MILWQITKRYDLPSCVKLIDNMGLASKQFPLTLFCVVIGLVLTASGAQGPVDTISPEELIRRAVTNEVKWPDADKKYMFQNYRKNPTATQTAIYAQTRDAMAGIIIAINDKPLDETQRKGEMWRVKRFIDDPDELKKKQKQEKENAERVGRIIRALPDAFIYELDGTEMGRIGLGRSGEELKRLRFRPNPKYDPPSRVEQILTGMEGFILIDAKLNRIARIDGRLQKDVSFGWGILGHLDHGGHFLVEQGDVGDKHWQITLIDMAVTGKIFLFKNINVQSKETYSDFHPIASDLTFAQGVDLLKEYEAQWLLSQNKGSHP
jgi:hypothetical protein